MALLLLAMSRAYPQSPSALNAEAQEARFKENTNWKKSGEEAEENAIGWFFDRCSRSGSSPLKMVYFFSGVNSAPFPISILSTIIRFCQL